MLVHSEYCYWYFSYDSMHKALFSLSWIYLTYDINCDVNAYDITFKSLFCSGIKKASYRNNFWI